jgi:flagellar biosynthetic protein FliQ
MTEEIVIGIGHDALMTMLLIASPMLIAALVVGLAVSILQAITQINEATLTFIPKIAAIVIALLILSPWMSQIMTTYTTDLLSSLPDYVR